MKTVKIHMQDWRTGSPYVSTFTYETEKQLEEYLEAFKMGNNKIIRIEEEI